ncbi:MAG: metabolite traffic protein EboE [Phycisphaerales bacterium]|nr:metabolite traffic protein EboE [Phycisphaerales bacterium]
MRNLVAPGAWLGYCTNVHAGATLDATLANLRRYAAPIRAAVSPDAPMGIGLWLSDESSRDATGRLHELREVLHELGLVTFTLNGFPFGDFHQSVVKTAVYQPTWLRPERVAYTRRLAHILAAIMPDDTEGSISTLPLAWGGTPFSVDDSRRAWAHLASVVETLAQIEQDTGRCIHLDIEPEPGCVLGSHADAHAWLERHLPSGAPGDLVRRHLRVCHDICHAAIMFEQQAEVVRHYHDIGIRIGKVQVSSAIRAQISPAAAAQFRTFCEDRYQHQTTCRRADGGHTFEADLPDMLRRLKAGDPDAAGEWRVHFHVPIGLERFGELETTRSLIPECIDLLRHEVDHWEVETYAWSVLPPQLQADSLVEGIAAELRWLLEVLA